jgi:hypothetical protein
MFLFFAAATLIDTSASAATTVRSPIASNTAALARSRTRVRIPAVDARQRDQAYLAQAGFRNPDQLGKTKEVVACELKVFQGAVTFNRGITEHCVWQQSEPGWAVQSVTIEVKEDLNNRGRYSYDVVAENGQYFMNVKEIGDKWKAAIDAAAKVSDIEVKRRLEVDYQHHMETVYNVASNKNTIRLSATANGGLFRRSRIHVVAKAKLIRVE